MKSSFPRQICLLTAVLVFFLMPLLHAGSRFEKKVAEAVSENNNIIPAGADYPILNTVAEMNLYSPDDYQKRVVVSGGQDIGLALYADPGFRERILAYYQGITGSEAVADAVLRYAYENDIPFTLAFSLMWAESRFNPEAVNRNSETIDRGLFQLNSASFPDMSIEQFFDVETNVRVGLSYLRYCLNMGETEIIALAMYNAGHYRVNSRGAPLMTLEHISNILFYREQLERDFERYISRQGKIRADKTSDRNLIPVSQTPSKLRKKSL